MILCCLSICFALGTKRSQSSVGKALLTFLGVNPPALKVGPCEYAMMCMLDVKILCYLFPVVMQCNVTPDFHHCNDELVLFVFTVLSIFVAALFSVDKNIDNCPSGRTHIYFIFNILIYVISRVPLFSSYQ
jgi:hypothetical protein